MIIRAVRHAGRAALIWFSFCLPASAHDDAAPQSFRLEETVIYGRSENLVGSAPAASAGRVGQAEIETVPILRVGEVLERVPGLIATQHSGTGKANQFFLRGFNLDHGTDFSTFLEGVPLNMPTHGHGQGYLDVNSIIPELIEVLEFRKGPYYADVGDFSSAGTSSLDYVRRLDHVLVSATVGQFDYYRVLAAGSHSFGDNNDLLLGAEMNFYNGPWDLDEELEKFNGLAKWTWGDDARGFSLLASGYSADWNASDQIPRRAVQGDEDNPKGEIDRFGYLDDDLGGNTSRYTGTARFWNGAENPTRAQAYVVFYDLDLWSNFTYFLDDQVNGDEFQQVDERTVVGGTLSQEINHTLASIPIRHTIGTQIRRDIITKVGLFHTKSREKLDTVRQDQVDETSLGLYYGGEARLLPWMRAYFGLRGDIYWFDVDAISLPANSGNDSDGIASPKVGVAFGPWADTEIYLNYGRGFHSNDARGTTITEDPTTGDPADRVDALVATQGAEIGTRTAFLQGLQSTLAFWWLDLDSELLFIGDAGNTEATRPSRRYGLEFANYYRPLDWLALDADFTFTHSEFRDDDPAGDEIPGAIETTVAAGAAVDFDNGIFGSLRLRHFGPRPLIEDGSVTSSSTTLVNLRAGYDWVKFPWGHLTFTLDVLNLLDSVDDDITYFYESRLDDEGEEGFEDQHFHPVEPVMVRGSITWRY